jgi:hypothetical protein
MLHSLPAIRAPRGMAHATRLARWLLTDLLSALPYDTFVSLIASAALERYDPSPALMKGLKARASRIAMGLGTPLPTFAPGTGPTPATSSLGLGSALPHLRLDRAHPAHTCTRTGLTPATSAPGQGSPRPHLHRDWAQPFPLLSRAAWYPALHGCGRGGQGLLLLRAGLAPRPQGAALMRPWRRCYGCCG